MPVHAAGIRYAAPAANGAGDCSSWENACTLQSALTGSTAGDEIWVAAGLHKPTTMATDRVATFQLKSGVAVYGGFAGTETARAERDFDTNVTILSGDIDNNDSQTPIITDLDTVTGNTTNSYNVVIGSGTDNTAILDGFTVTGGNANAYPHTRGGGMWNDSGSPTLTNVTLSGNTAANNGGGMYTYQSNMQLTNVTFSHNHSYDGGAMYNNTSSPQLTNVAFNGNTAGNSGGGIYNDFGSNPSLVDVTFSGNDGGNSGGGMLNVGSNPTLTDVTFIGNFAGGGGAMSNRYESNPTLTNVTFSNNTAIEGGGMSNYQSSPILTNVTFSNNTAANIYGGGMYSEYGSNPTLTDVIFSGNSAYRGGGMYNHQDCSPLLLRVTFSGNHADVDGGGLYNSFGDLTVTDSTFEQNYAIDGYGGGIAAAGGTVTITNSTFSGNSSSFGGAILHSGSNPAGEMTITNSTFDGNNATEYGGGILNNDPLTITNSTLSGNTAGFDGGGIQNNSLLTITNSTLFGNTAGLNGGGLNNLYGTVTVINSTFSANGANGAGGGIRNENTMSFSNTIVANSTSGGDCSNNSTISTNTNNLVEDGSCSAAISGDPTLAPLANYGGVTQTLALLEGSTAIDAGDDATCAAAPVNNTSQNGVTRPYGAHCDIGANEYEVETAAPRVLSIMRLNPNPTQPASVDFIVYFSKSVTGVDTNDFSVATTGSISGASPTLVDGGPTIYTVTVDTGSGEGTLRLDVIDDNTIQDLTSSPLGGPDLNDGDFTTGEFYTIDATAPTVGAFTVTTPSSSLDIPITAFTASDAVGVTGYLITESAAVPAADAAGWTSTAPGIYTVALSGSHTLYPWAKDAAGNVSSVFGSPQVVVVDTPPTVNTFTIPGMFFDNPTIPIAAFITADDVGVTGYLITTSSTPPMAGDAGWTGTAPTSFTVASDGFYQLYPWARDTAGHVSAVFASPAFVAVNAVDLTVTSITRHDPNPTNLASVSFTVTFSEPVTGVDMVGPTFDDFILTTSSGISDASVLSVSGAGTTFTVTVSTGSGNGLLRLDVGTDGQIADEYFNPLTAGFTAGETYDVIKTATFTDVPLGYWANTFIERLYASGITGGCSASPLNYCPDSTVTRAQMAVFLLVAEHGTGYTPPPATGIFNDVPASNGFAKWIEQLAAEGITGGCGNGNYCPNTPVTREQMAVFLLVAEHGTGYTPPAATGVFADVPVDNPFARWIEQLAAEGITGGCGEGNFCPKTTVNRAQMAVFLVMAFNLP
jgi:predicted outer membrane repeat protein